jgi:3-hydroxypropanoate dehydrogenase
MTATLTQEDLDLIFNDARTYNGWLDKAVDDGTLTQAFDLMKMAPTSANCSPLRILFVRSEEAKGRLKPCLMEANVEKTMTAPICAIFADDTRFHEHLPQLFPHADAKSWFEGNDALIAETAFRNSTLQAAYFILAARSVGLDCGPMSGFDKELCNKTFFPDGRFQVNFLCNLGYGDPSSIYPRSPRFDFADACEII